MATDSHPPPNYHSSMPSSTSTSTSSALPPEVVACLDNARFLHLATCDSLFPHVSLMNYTYLPSSPYSSHPVIIMTTNPASKKTLNLQSNPRVSLLVHDWVSHRPPTATTQDRTSPDPPQLQSSSLATLLQNLNSSALSSISTTINGTARMVERGTEEEQYYKRLHLENNTFGDQAKEERGALAGEGDGGRGCFIAGEQVIVVVVRVRDGRIADWKGEVRDWSVVGADDDENMHDTAAEPLVNGT